MGDVVKFKKRRGRPDGTKSVLRNDRPSGLAVLGGLRLILVGVAAVAILGYVGFQAGMPLVGCDIKGNVAYGSRDKIYHLPGQAYYSKTNVNLLNGDRWFCSEESAMRAGWRRSRI